MKLKLRLLTILALLVLVLLPVGTVWATCPPSPLQLFTGTVTVGGSPADDGTSITAWVGGIERASTTTSGGSYGIQLCPDDYGGQLVTFNVDGTYGGEATCPASSGPPVIVNLVVVIVTEPDIWVTPTTKNFGEVQVGTKSPAQTFDVGNNGNADLDVGTITLTGSDPDQFEITFDAVSGQTISPAGSDELQVKFTPSSSGTQTATLRIPSNDPDEDPLDVSLRGRGSSAPTPPPGDVSVQVAFLLDSSGSIGSSNWNIMVNGLADAVADSRCFPHDGSIELTVVRFGCTADVPVGPVVITSGNADSVAADIADINYWNDGCTCIACAFDEAADALENSPNYSRSLKQAINLVTDGYPDCWGCAVDARDNCIDDLDMTAAQDVICCEGIGSGVDMDWLTDEIAFPQPGCEWPIGDPNPECDGWVRQVDDAEEFADTICEKLEAIVVSPVVCDFSATPTRGRAPMRVQLTDESTGPVTSWLWDFGDGKTSTQRNPMHIYPQPGSFTVTLTLNGDSTECETIIEVDPDMVAQEGPNLAAAYLLVSPEQGRPGQEFEISINVGNDGGATGTRSIVLYINGELEQSQTVSVSAGASKLLVFRVTKSEPGVYQVLLEGNEGQFTVIDQADAKNYPGPLGTPGIIVIVVVAIILIGAIVFVFMRRE